MEGLWRSAAGAALLAGVLGGCAVVGGLLSPPEIALQSLQPTLITPQVLEFSARLAVTNPNPITVPLAGLEGAVEINGRRLLSTNLSGLSPLASHGVQQLSVPLRLNYPEVLAAAAALPGARELQVGFSGRLRVTETWSLPPIPFSFQVKLPLPKIPEISFSGFKLLGPEKRIGLALKVRNRNPFPLTVNALSSRLQVNGRPYTLLSLSGPVNLDSGASQEIVLRLGDSLKKTTELVKDVLLGKKISYHLSGNLDGSTPWGKIQAPIGDRGDASEQGVEERP